MAKIIFVLITQLRNSTNRRVGFRVDGYCPPLRDLAPGKTRNLNPSRILQCCRHRGSPDWKIRVLIDDLFTGIELDPLHLLIYTRIVFRYQTRKDDVGVDVLCVHGIPESCSDYFLRLKYFGWMRNFIWDSRSSTEIAREDPRVAKKLRDIEGAAGQQVAPFLADKTSLKSQLCTSPTRKGDEEHGEEEKRDGPVTTVPFDKSKEKTLSSPPPSPPPPSHPPVTRDGFGDFLNDETDASDHESSTSTSDTGEDVVSGTHAQTRVSSTNVDRRISGRREQWVDSSGRYMDSFDYLILFIFAFTLVWCLTRLFA